MDEMWWKTITEKPASRLVYYSQIISVRGVLCEKFPGGSIFWLCWRDLAQTVGEVYPLPLSNFLLTPPSLPHGQHEFSFMWIVPGVV